jgi:hypothetical protein
MSAIQNANTSYNNSAVVSIMPKSQLKNVNFVDSSLLGSLDPSMLSHNLGLVNLLQSRQIIKVPLLSEIFANKDIIEVNGEKSHFEYETLMDVEYPTVVQAVTEGEKLGLGGVPFKIKTSHVFKQGDVLLVDYYDGLQLHVVEGEEIVDEGDGYVHTVELNIKDPDAYFQASLLVKGTRITRGFSTMGEYSENAWSGIQGGGVPTKVKHRFNISSPQGIEVNYTAAAMSINMGEGKDMSHIQEYLLRKAKGMGDINLATDPAYLVIGKKVEGNKQVVQKVEKLMSILALGELAEMQATRMMFAQGATYTSIKGAKRVNEGFYPAMRRGHRFTYSNTTELKEVLKRASDVVFQQNQYTPMELRRIKMRGGFEAVTLVRQIFKEQFISTNPLFLDQKAVPVPILTGTDRHNLTYDTFTIGEAFIAGIGKLKIEHDPSFDYDYSDIIQRGYQRGRNKRSWSLAIFDISDSNYSNAFDASLLPNGVSVMEGSKNKNFFAVKNKNAPAISYGYETGRVNGENVRSMRTSRDETFYAQTQLDPFILDYGKVVLIEREDAFTEAAARFN